MKKEHTFSGALIVLVTASVFCGVMAGQYLERAQSSAMANCQISRSHDVCFMQLNR